MSEPVASNYAAGAALDNATTLFGDLVNLKQFTLTSNIASGDTTIPTSGPLSSINFPCYALIDSEIIYVPTNSIDSFTSAVRGAGGTTAVSHTSGASIFIIYAANISNQLKRAIIAIETVLGLTPQSTYADVATRITKDELGVGLTSYATTTSMVGTLTLTDASKPVQIVTAAAPQTIVLPALASTNHPFFIIVKTGSSAITIQNASLVTIATLSAGFMGSFYSDGATNWFGLTQIDTSTFVTLTGVQTLTNKTITSRESQTTSAASLTPNSDSFDLYTFTAQAAGLTINADAGTPTSNRKLIIKVKDNGTPQTFTWNAQYVNRGGTLPTTTVAGKWVRIGLIWAASTSTWDCVSVAQE